MRQMIPTKEPEYTVARKFVDGRTEIVCTDQLAIPAAMEFWRCTNNVSAHAGLVKQVVLTDGLDQIGLAWEQGRGYTYDGGETFYESPIETEGWH